MDLNQIIGSGLDFLNSIPAVGSILAKVAQISVSASLIASAGMAAARAFVLFADALAKIPGLGGLAAISEKLKKGEEDGESILKKYVLPVIDRLSIVPPAKK